MICILAGSRRQRLTPGESREDEQHAEKKNLQRSDNPSFDNDAIILSFRSVIYLRNVYEDRATLNHYHM